MICFYSDCPSDQLYVSVDNVLPYFIVCWGIRHRSVHFPLQQSWIQQKSVYYIYVNRSVVLRRYFKPSILSVFVADSWVDQIETGFCICSRFIEWYSFPSVSNPTTSEMLSRYIDQSESICFSPLLFIDNKIYLIFLALWLKSSNARDNGEWPGGKQPLEGNT